MPAYTFVDQPDRIVPELGSHARIGLDTEFMRERTYFSQLCLVQVSANADIYCVDPLVDDDMASFWATLCDRTWIAHAARQDIEVIYQAAGRMPSALFDTQVAAGLLGMQPQIGYGNLVSELFDVELPKSHTRANWAERPLPDRYLEYAAEDVEYLLPACDILAEQLDRKGRLAWAEADSMLLTDPALYDIDPKTAVDRLKGARRLRGKQRAVAERLAEWREKEALQRDKPRQWILRDSVIIDIACKMPASPEQLRGISDMPAKVIQRKGDEILRRVSQALGDSNGYRPPGAPDESQKNLLKRMQKIVADCASDLGIAAETIASKKELSAVIIDGNRNSRVFEGWRRDLIGEQLTALL